VTFAELFFNVEQRGYKMKTDRSLLPIGSSVHSQSLGSASLSAPGPSRRRLLKSFCSCCLGIAIAPTGLSLLAAADSAGKLRPLRVRFGSVIFLPAAYRTCYSQRRAACSKRQALMHN
jgi:hypothetical protein